jgi:hypothetical protein
VRPTGGRAVAGRYATRVATAADIRSMPDRRPFDPRCRGGEPKARHSRAICTPGSAIKHLVRGRGNASARGWFLPCSTPDPSAGAGASCRQSRAVIGSLDDGRHIGRAGASAAVLGQYSRLNRGSIGDISPSIPDEKRMNIRGPNELARKAGQPLLACPAVWGKRPHPMWFLVRIVPHTVKPVKVFPLYRRACLARLSATLAAKTGIEESTG